MLQSVQSTPLSVIQKSVPQCQMYSRPGKASPHLDALTTNCDLFYYDVVVPHRINIPRPTSPRTACATVHAPLLLSAKPLVAPLYLGCFQ